MRFKVGSLYEIQFMDHTVGLERPFLCKVPGYVIDDHDDYVKLTTWEVVTNDKEVKENNLELVCIMKNTIKKRRIIP